MATWREVGADGEFHDVSVEERFSGDSGPYAFDPAQSYGPTLYDDPGPDIYDSPDGDPGGADEVFDPTLQEGFRSTKNMLVDQDPVLENNVARYKNLKGLLTPVTVSDINNPAAELSGLNQSGQGSFLLVRGSNSSVDEFTLYTWDPAVSGGADVPYVVAGDSGYWVAHSGKYRMGAGTAKGNQAVTGNLSVSGTLTAGSATISNNLVAESVNIDEDASFNTTLGSNKFQVNVGTGVGFEVDPAGPTISLNRANVVVNDTAANASFRVEGSGQQYLIYTTPTTDCVGIRTGSPAAVLDVNGNGRFGTGLLVNADGASSGDVQVKGDTDDYLIFADASTDRVGVGAGSPAAKLHVWTGSSGVTPYTADGGPEVIIEDDSIPTLHMLGSNTGSARIWFASPQSNIAGAIVYNYNATATAQSMWFRVGGATRATVTGDGSFRLPELASTPGAGASGTEVNIYMRNDNIVFQFNDGGTTRYLYAPLAGTSATWTKSTTAP